MFPTKPRLVSERALVEKKYLDACYLGNIKMVKRMLQKEDRVFNNDYFLVKCLNRACDGDSSVGRNGNCIKLCAIILKYRDIDKMVCRCVFQLLLHTCKMGNLALIKLYTQLFTKLSENEAYYISMMYNACKSGNVDLIRYMRFLIYGSNNKNARLVLNKSKCLENACLSGNMESVKLFVEYGGLEWGWDANWNEYRIWENCLNKACKSGNIEVVNYALYEKYAMVSSDTLYYAGASGNMEVVDLIVNYINMNYYSYRNKDGGIYEDYRKILHGACSKGHLEIVKLCIDKIDIDKISDPSIEECIKKCMGWACQYGYVEIFKYMDDMIANDVSFDNWNIYASRACTVDENINNAEILELLIKKGANEYNYYMYHTCLHGLTDFVEVLVTNGATNWDNGLLGACKGGYPDLVRLMINYGAKLNINLMYNFETCWYLHPDICKILITNGANEFERLVETDNFKLYCFWLRSKESDGSDNDYKNDSRWMQLLAEHPTCVLLVGGKIMAKRAKRTKRAKCAVRKLPDELYVLLAEY